MQAARATCRNGMQSVLLTKGTQERLTMALTREQAQKASDITYEDVFVPEWLSKEQRAELATLDGQLSNLNGDDPALRADLEKQRDVIRENGTCCVWMLTALECEKLQADTQKNLGPNKKQNEHGFYARLVVMTVRDRDGVPTFTSADESWLSRKSVKVLNRIANVALRINGLTKQDQDEILKN